MTLKFHSLEKKFPFLYCDHSFVRTPIAAACPFVTLLTLSENVVKLNDAEGIKINPTFYLEQ